MGNATLDEPRAQSAKAFEVMPPKLVEFIWMQQATDNHMSKKP